MVLSKDEVGTKINGNCCNQQQTPNRQRQCEDEIGVRLSNVEKALVKLAGDVSTTTNYLSKMIKELVKEEIRQALLTNPQNQNCEIRKKRSGQPKMNHPNCPTMNSTSVGMPCKKRLSVVHIISSNEVSSISPIQQSARKKNLGKGTNAKITRKRNVVAEEPVKHNKRGGVGRNHQHKRAKDDAYPIMEKISYNSLIKPQLMNPVLVIRRNRFVSWKSMSSLGPTKWIVNDVIDVYGEIVQYEKNKLDSLSKRKYWYMDTMFSYYLTKNSCNREDLVRLLRNNHVSPKIEECHHIMIPINYANIHWYCVLVDLSVEVVYVLDSIPDTSRASSVHSWMHLLDYCFQTIFGDKYKHQASRFQVLRPTLPKQSNSSIRKRSGGELPPRS